MAAVDGVGAATARGRRAASRWWRTRAVSDSFCMVSPLRWRWQLGSVAARIEQEARRPACARSTICPPGRSERDDRDREDPEVLPLDVLVEVVEQPRHPRREARASRCRGRRSSSRSRDARPRARRSRRRTRPCRRSAGRSPSSSRRTCRSRCATRPVSRDIAAAAVARCPGPVGRGGAWSTRAACSSISSAIGGTPRQPQYSHTSAHPVPAAARPVAAELGVVAAAVDDVGAGQVAERRAEHVHEPGERPQREQARWRRAPCSWKPRGASAISVGVRVEAEEPAEPDRDAFAVVVVPPKMFAGDGVARGPAR